MPQLAPAGPVRRGSGLVVLDGSDSLTESLAPLLHDLGVRLEVGTTAADAVDLAVRAGDDEAVPDLVVLAGQAWVQPSRWATWRSLGIPHLPIDWERRRVSVGPVVVPGSPCLGCLALHRYDVRRSGRGTLARPDRNRPDGGDPVLATLGAGIAALLTRNLVLHRRYLPGLSLEVNLPDPHIVTRRWAPHPRCDGHIPQDRMAL
ncbi:MAG: hypothetical protein IPK37_14170 [Austwickia sp.]|jgi:hypothetical protein|nr:MAG: hypothetical protein IPK37_14170 [Austwickia sp.]